MFSCLGFDVRSTWIEIISPSFRAKRCTAINILRTIFFSVRTVSYGTSFSPLDLWIRTRKKNRSRNLQYGSWTRLVRSICWSTLREAGDAEGIPTNVLGALHSGGYRDNPHPAIVLSKLLYGLLAMQLVFLVKRRHTSVRHYIHRLSSKRPISFLINSRKDVDHSIRRFHPSCEESSARPRKKSKYGWWTFLRKLCQYIFLGMI